MMSQGKQRGRLYEQWFIEAEQPFIISVGNPSGERRDWKVMAEGAVQGSRGRFAFSL